MVLMEGIKKAEGIGQKAEVNPREMIAFVSSRAESRRCAASERKKRGVIPNEGWVARWE